MKKSTYLRDLRFEISDGPDRDGRYRYVMFWTAYHKIDNFNPRSGDFGPRSQHFHAVLDPRMTPENTKGYPNG